VRWVWALTCAIGCGRIDFDPLQPLPPPRVVNYGVVQGNDNQFEALVAQTAVAEVWVDDTTPLDATLLADIDLLIVQALYNDHTAAESAALHAWLAAGGTLIVLAGYEPDDIAMVNLVISDLGVQYEPPIVDGPVVAFGRHPTTAGVGTLPFLGGYTLTHGAGFTDIATIDTNLVGAVAEVGTGRALLWGDEWVTLDGMWSADTIRFWTDVLGWLRRET
jgi:hypothetical protein